MPNVLGPGGDVSTSEGKDDLEAAQVEFPGGLDQHQKQMEKRALEPDKVKAAYAVQTIYGFWICKGTLPHLE